MAQIDSRTFEKEGFLVLPGLFTKDEMEEWKLRLKERIVGDEKLDKGAGVRVWFCNELDALTASKVASERLVQALNEIVGPDVEFLSVKAVFKDSITSFPSPWHQDWHYWEGTTKISVWIALDDATRENGCLRLVPRSHRDVIEMQHVSDGKGFVNRISEESVDDKTVLEAEVKAGDAIFFHDLTLHSSCPNTNGKDRWSAIATYRDASQKDSSKIWAQSILLTGESVNH